MATPTPPVPLSSSKDNVPSSLLPLHLDESVSEASNIPSSPPQSPPSSPSLLSLKNTPLTENDHVTTSRSDTTESTGHVTDHVTTTSTQTSSCATSTRSDHVTAATSHMGSSASNPPLVAGKGEMSVLDKDQVERFQPLLYKHLVFSPV